jgi:hypothetical protein
LYDATQLPLQHSDFGGNSPNEGTGAEFNAVGKKKKIF